MIGTEAPDCRRLNRSYAYCGRVATKQSGLARERNTGMSDWGARPALLSQLSAQAEPIGIVEM